MKTDETIEVGSLMGNHCTVYLDGVEQKLCVEANWYKGYIIRYVTNKEGKPLLGPGANLQTELVYGKVRLVVETPYNET